MEKSNLINWNILESSNLSKELIDEIELLNYKDLFENNISFRFDNNIFQFEFIGIKILITTNTNKFIRRLFDSKGRLNLFFDEQRVDEKDLVIISPLSKINDIINTKSSNFLSKYLKDNDSHNDNMKIEEVIGSLYNSKDENVKKITDIDLTKAQLISFLSVSEEFIDENNIINILNILRSKNKRLTIIFNDVNYISYKECEKWMKWFNFIFVLNNNENKNFNNNLHDFILIEKSNKIISFYDFHQ
ncbi:MAG: hypothetical protein ACRC4L_03250 [Mycoplasma sp.]